MFRRRCRCISATPGTKKLGSSLPAPSGKYSGNSAVPQCCQGPGSAMVYNSFCLCPLEVCVYLGHRSWTACSCDRLLLTIGAVEGCALGAALGCELGTTLGAVDGCAVKAVLGCELSTTLGREVGAALGLPLFVPHSALKLVPHSAVKSVPYLVANLVPHSVPHWETRLVANSVVRSALHLLQTWCGCLV
jgi:hypothetical protein